jgi:phosphatidylethanolamine/phosphatidyl-N-methylethanolamine N-methyltransferase
MTFVREFVRHPFRTGALGSTSRACVEAFLDDLELASARRVVELGAGTGAITTVLSRRLPPEARLLAVEVSPTLARRLSRRCTAGNVEVVCASAVELRDLLTARGITAVDHVVSALPWTFMPPEEQGGILRAVCQVLHGDATFSTLLAAHRTHTRAGRRFDDLLRQTFAKVEQGPTLWANIPPLRAYHCRRSP